MSSIEWREREGGGGEMVKEGRITIDIQDNDEEEKDQQMAATLTTTTPTTRQR